MAGDDQSAAPGWIHFPGGAIARARAPVSAGLLAFYSDGFRALGRYADLEVLEAEIRIGCHLC